MAEDALGLAVGVAAIADPENMDPITMVVKADPPITDAEPKLRRMYASESLHVAGAGLGKTVDGTRNTKANGAVECRQISLRLRGKDDALDHAGSR